MFRIIVLAVVMAALIIGAAFPNLIPPQIRDLFREDDSSPKAVACRAEAVAKYPADMEEIGRTPDGTGRTMINRNANAYAEAYAACMKR